MKVQFLNVLVLVLVAVASSQNTKKCPFEYLYHFGDGITDVGNSVLAPPDGPSNPATRPPYGISVSPGKPIGRWSDGYVDFDYASTDFGFPNITPYLKWKPSSGKGVVFSVARSPVLDHEFFKSRGIKVPAYAASLNTQLSWFKTYLKSVCSKEKDCAAVVNSLLMLGDLEANDIGYALTQGKTIEEVKEYVPLITQAQINVTRELISLGGTLIVVPGNAPVGCFPYLLTALASDNPADYDELGCLKSVNDLIKFKNAGLQQAVANLAKEFPNIRIFYGDFGTILLQLIKEAVSGPNKDIALKACCGTGGKYNYDSNKFCGSPGVPVCSNPKDYLFWDGLHLTQEAQYKNERVTVALALKAFNCTT